MQKPQSIPYPEKGGGGGSLRHTRLRSAQAEMFLHPYPPLKRWAKGKLGLAPLGRIRTRQIGLILTTCDFLLTTRSENGKRLTGNERFGKLLTAYCKRSSRV
jgi:hypothetical protein